MIGLARELLLQINLMFGEQCWAATQRAAIRLRIERIPIEVAPQAFAPLAWVAP